MTNIERANRAATNAAYCYMLMCDADTDRYRGIWRKCMIGFQASAHNFLLFERWTREREQR